MMTNAAARPEYPLGYVLASSKEQISRGKAFWSITA
jgi:hypothetical protein